MRVVKSKMLSTSTARRFSVGNWIGDEPFIHAKDAYNRAGSEQTEYVW